MEVILAVMFRTEYPRRHDTPSHRVKVLAARHAWLQFLVYFILRTKGVGIWSQSQTTKTCSILDITASTRWYITISSPVATWNTKFLGIYSPTNHCTIGKEWCSRRIDSRKTMTGIGLNKRYLRVHCPENFGVNWWLCLMQAMSFSRWSRLPGWHKNIFWQECCWKFITEMTYDTRENEAHLWKWKKIYLLTFKDYRIAHSIAIDFTIFLQQNYSY